MTINHEPDAPAGRILIDLFVTLDGVAQGPGGVDEDTSGGFRFSGWQAGQPDSEVVGREVWAGMSDLDALLLGRRTYDIFAAYWPQHTEGDEGPIGRLFNDVPKYVATRDGGRPLDWTGSTRVGADLAAELAGVRARHREAHVIGSVDLVQTLLAEGLYDELRLWVYPVVLGEGKKVFPDGAAPANLRLIEAPIVAENGAVLLRYAPRAGVPEVGTF